MTMNDAVDRAWDKAADHLALDLAVIEALDAAIADFQADPCLRTGRVLRHAIQDWLTTQ